MNARIPRSTITLALGCSLYAAAALAAQPPGSPRSPLEVQRVAGAGDCLKPCIQALPGGGACMAWALKEGERTAVVLATAGPDLRFGTPVAVSREGMDLDLGAENGPQVAVGPRGVIHVTWASGSWKVSPPAAMRHAGGGTRSGPPPRPGNLNIYMATSRDGGKSFEAPIKVNDDPDRAEHRFPTIAVDAEGTVHLAWLDKRLQNAERSDFSRVFVTRSRDGGRSFERNVDATAGQAHGICHCCRIGLALGRSGRVVVSYRDDAEDIRDHMLAESRDGGRTFAVPVRVESTMWKIPACPFNGPSLGYDESGKLHIAWMSGGDFNGKPATGPAEGGRYKVFYRRDMGSVSRPSFLAFGAHPRLVVKPNGTVFLGWEQEGIRLAELTGGRLVRATTLTAPEVSAAFPSLAIDESGRVLAAWQQRGTEDRWEIRVRALTPAARP